MPPDFKAKCTKFEKQNFAGAPPQISLGGAYSTPPDPIAAFKGAYFFGKGGGKGSGGDGGGKRNGKGRGGEVAGGEGREEEGPGPHQIFWPRTALDRLYVLVVVDKT